MTLSKKKPPRVLVIGLDCFTPNLIFDEFIDELPFFSKLIKNGYSGKLRSTDPPITSPAWSTMLTGVDPGTLGIYGFRHRKLGSYTDDYIAINRHVNVDRVWDILSRHGYDVGILGVPQTYPPNAVNGFMISSFLTPGNDKPFAYPPELKDEVLKLVKNYKFDAESHRTKNKDQLLQEIYQLTDDQFLVSEYLLTNKPWNFFMTVFMGPDRIQHGFWHYMDPQHRFYTDKNPYKNAIKDYYIYLDEKLQHITSFLPEDTIIIIVSDHGARRLDGCFNLNQWLIQEGYLVLKNQPTAIKRLEANMVDWSRTKAWSWGGYIGNIFINLKTREPHGIVPPENYEQLRSELIKRLKQIKDLQGRPLDNKVFRPEDLYENVSGDYPDLIVYFDDLNLRAAGTIGHPDLFLSKNDLGEDDINHDYYGVFIISSMQQKTQRKNTTSIMNNKRQYQLNIMDIAPIILSFFDIQIPKQLQGNKPSWL